MKIKIILLLAAVVLLVTGFMNNQQEDQHPGQKVFMDSKCTTCHTVQSHDLTSKKKDAQDLSGVGTVYQANFLELFLKKQEKVDDKSHPQSFKGTDEQLEQLVEWLTTLKQESKDGMGTEGSKEMGKPKTEEDKDTSDSDYK
jgi:FtsZ-interacting cell division protein ZipA